jgi:hypothetical protein
MIIDFGEDCETRLLEKMQKRERERFQRVKFYC